MLFSFALGSSDHCLPRAFRISSLGSQLASVWLAFWSDSRTSCGIWTSRRWNSSPFLPSVIFSSSGKVLYLPGASCAWVTSSHTPRRSLLIFPSTEVLSSNGPVGAGGTRGRPFGFSWLACSCFAAPLAAASSAPEAAGTTSPRVRIRAATHSIRRDGFFGDISLQPRILDFGWSRTGAIGARPVDRPRSKSFPGKREARAGDFSHSAGGSNSSWQY